MKIMSTLFEFAYKFGPPDCILDLNLGPILVLVLANASVSDPIAISSKSAALPGQTLRRQAFVPQLLVAF